ncbi:MAG: hypothetical protein AUI11_03410 [Acidobacteria bacterium 13_2_20CM_2_66_4]|nr:MAG: hypothetical protein AUI11_03410 [Acidobacteria bacterium 13_2_20CM_2_66_4]
MTIFTIGHSTRSLDDFIALLHSHGINRLADIRTVPKSRRHPHFAGDALARSLSAEDVAYRHFPGLGGLRKPKRDSTNTGWRHEGFRGYADYMQTAEFARALEELIDWARGGPERAAPQLDNDVMRVERATPQLHEDVARAEGAVPPGNVARAFQARVAIMCAEALWWRCHRQLVADALVAPGIEVRHIASASSAPLHTLTDFARVDAGRVSYPGLL